MRSDQDADRNQTADWPSGQRSDLGGELSADIAGVDDAAGLQQENCGLRIGARAMLDAPRHDEQVAWPEDHVAVTHLDGELAAQDEEQLFGVIVLVPREVTLELDDPHVVVVDLRDLLR